MPNYSWMHSAVCAVAGEGTPLTAEQIGKTARDFMYDDILLVILKGMEVIYSMNRADGAVAVEFLGRYIGQN